VFGAIQEVQDAVCRSVLTEPVLCLAQGTVGDAAQSVFMSPRAASTFQSIYPTGPTINWRVYGLDENNGNPGDNWTCYTDSSAVTVNP
jgi:hypothetical protein